MRSSSTTSTAAAATAAAAAAADWKHGIATALGRGNMQTIMLCSLLFVSLVFVNTSQAAPVALAADDADNRGMAEKPLIRTKRSEEIVYGNHQNEPREKKSTEAKEDESSKMEEESTKPDTNKQGPTDETDPEKMERKKRNAPAIQLVKTAGDTTRAKRNIQLSPMMTAENMAAGFARRSKQMRTKRDLDYEQLREILEGSDGQEQPQYDQEAAEAAAEEKFEENLLAAAEEQREREYEREKLQVEEELAREILELNAEKDKREQLLEYLLKANDDEEEETIIQPSSEEEGYETGSDVAPEADGYYVDRSQNNLAPALLKRGSDIYPYSYEGYGGRWSALVPGQKRHSADSYERLYRLAQALNDDDYENNNEISDEK